MKFVFPKFSLRRYIWYFIFIIMMLVEQKKRKSKKEFRVEIQISEKKAEMK